MQNLAMISTKNHSLYSIISISIVLFITQLLIRVDLFYISDPLIKWIQVVSLWNQNWTTESIIFPTKDMDPLFLMSPLNENFVFLHQDRLIATIPNWVYVSLFFTRYHQPPIPSLFKIYLFGPSHPSDVKEQIQTFGNPICHFRYCDFPSFD